MLQTLRIRDYALIDDLEIEFDSGLNVLTGETGAGKSIILGALGLILGARASSDGVRTGAKRTAIEAVFLLDPPSRDLSTILDEHGIETEAGELILSRVVSAEGRSKAYAGGRLVPVSVLSAIGDELVDVHGQHEHQSILRSDRQLMLLDGFAQLHAERAGLAGRVRTLRDVRDRIDALETNDRDQLRRLEFLKFETDEIDQTHLEPGEEEALEGRRALLANAERILENVSLARSRLSDSDQRDAALDRLASAFDALDAIADVNEELARIAERLRSVMNEVETASMDLLPFAEMEEFDPKELDAIHARLDILRTLKRKYGDSIEEVLAYRDRIGAEIESLNNRDQALEDMKAQLASDETEILAMAKKLSKKRRAAAALLNERVSDSLRELGMEDAVFQAGIEDGPLTLSGLDRIEFLLAANKGENVKPLKHVASGGEISRIMLALKSVFATADAVPTLIFDEIDAGIGGLVATHVAERLRDLSRSHQTLCITHLAQIAAAGATHFHVSKRTRKDRTTTHVARVEAGSRIEEVARLLDGSITKLSRDHAENLLNKLAG